MNASTLKPLEKPSREEWERRQAESLATQSEIRAVYQSHMHHAAHQLYLAGECVKRGEFGGAASYHDIAARDLEAARKALPV